MAIYAATRGKICGNVMLGKLTWVLLQPGRTSTLLPCRQRVHVPCFSYCSSFRCCLVACWCRQTYYNFLCSPYTFFAIALACCSKSGIVCLQHLNAWSRRHKQAKARAFSWFPSYFSGPQGIWRRIHLCYYFRDSLRFHLPKERQTLEDIRRTNHIYTYIPTVQGHMVLLS